MVPRLSFIAPGWNSGCITRYRGILCAPFQEPIERVRVVGLVLIEMAVAIGGDRGGANGHQEQRDTQHRRDAGGSRLNCHAAQPNTPARTVSATSATINISATGARGCIVLPFLR